MNEFEPIKKSSDQIEIVDQSQVKRHRDHLGTVKLQRGQRLYELNLDTLDIMPVLIKDLSVDIGGSLHRDYTVKENHLYVVALNRRNAERKFIMMARNIKKMCSGQ